MADGAEVMWRRADVADAIDALADAGKVVLGLDLRRVDADGRFIELAWSAFEPTGDDDCRTGRLAALSALERVDADGRVNEFEWVLVTWE
ncbi:MAG: hypothetical protein HRT86_16465 [Ilumatobacteraceae bacterium]|nr:hypothetical protein [Ilumatobacteraceae bacterium]